MTKDIYNSAFLAGYEAGTRKIASTHKRASDIVDSIKGHISDNAGAYIGGAAGAVGGAAIGAASGSRGKRLGRAIIGSILGGGAGAGVGYGIDRMGGGVPSGIQETHDKAMRDGREGRGGSPAADLMMQKGRVRPFEERIDPAAQASLAAYDDDQALLSAGEREANNAMIYQKGTGTTNLPPDPFTEEPTYGPNTYDSGVALMNMPGARQGDGRKMNAGARMRNALRSVGVNIADQGMNRDPKVPARFRN